jgi:hypothetical protein
MLHAFHSFYVQILLSVLPDASNYWNEENLFALSPAIISTAVQVGTDVILLNPFCCPTVTFPFCNTFRRICVSPFHHFAGYSVLHPLFPDYYGLYDYSVITGLIVIIVIVLLLLLFLLLLLNSQQ